MYNGRWEEWIGNGKEQRCKVLRVVPWAMWIGICGEFEIGREFEFQVYIQLTLLKKKLNEGVDENWDIFVSERSDPFYAWKRNCVKVRWLKLQRKFWNR